MTKPDDKTWEEYIYDSEGREELWEEFGEEMATEVRAALEESELNESRYVVEEGHRPSIKADGWQMTEKGDVLELRDVLRDGDVGDESVGVYGLPRGADGLAELPPDHVGTQDFEYEVFINLRRNQEAIDAGTASADSKM